MHRWRLEEDIGEGAFSVVFRARSLASGKTAAVKLFRRKFPSWDEACEIQEIKSLLAVRGQRNVIQLSEFGREEDGTVFFVTPIYQGSIHQLLNEKRMLSEQDTAQMTKQMLMGLASLHAVGIVHRDVKPENILYRMDNNNMKIKLAIVVADFGSSAPFTNGAPMSNYVTTRFYRSPEMVFKDSQYGPMVDVWAAGCVAFEALAGQPLFPARGESDLLLQMCCILGSPDLKNEHVARMCSNFDLRTIPKQFPGLPPTRWFPSHVQCSAEAVQCIAKLVRWIPESRLDCLTALRTEPFLNC